MNKYIALNMPLGGKYDVIVVGAGHAGCEAGLISARMGMRTAMFCTDIESVAMMPCNPSIGGTGKGHLVREIDALGGEMGINIDKTFIQSKMLNTSKGPAVHSLRAQADKKQYHLKMLETIENQELLDLFDKEVTDLVIEDSTICGIIADEMFFISNTVILATGTFLGGKIFIGDYVKQSGPAGLAPATRLTQSLIDCGFRIRRFKTGTPARMIAASLDYSVMKEQKGDDEIVPFSFLNEDENIKPYSVETSVLPKEILSEKGEQASCYLSYTNKETHRIILDNINKSAMYSGNIVGIGPRYCPSIEDKVSRFKDRDRHQLFVEPESLDSEWVYIQGMSSSLPEDVQHEFYASISGLENAEIVRPAYAIEYDCIDPLTVKPSLESKIVKGVFCAGQFNGSSGYEEAAAQGLIAGINSVRFINNSEPLVLGREEAYIGVLIDDLVTKGTLEPYRIMTSRAEYRLLLRQDNADKRLTEIGYKYGSVDEDRYLRYMKKHKAVEEEIERLKHTRTSQAELNKFLVSRETKEADENFTLYEIIKRPEISYEDTLEIDNETRPQLTLNEKREVEVEIKYEGYIRKQIQEVEKLRKLEGKKLDESINYNEIAGLRIEAQQKLNKIKPMTVGQASRISGVSPADINVLLIYLEKRLREN